MRLRLVHNVLHTAQRRSGVAGFSLQVPAPFRRHPAQACSPGGESAAAGRNISGLQISATVSRGQMKAFENGICDIRIIKGPQQK